MTIDLVHEFANAISADATSSAYGSGELLTLPMSLTDGESVSIYVERVGDDLYLLSDRGLAADALTLAGVDLSSKGAAASWAAVRSSLTLAERMMDDTADDFEIAGSATRAELGHALVALGEAVLRADGLRVLGRAPRRLTFADRVMKSAAEADLTIVPKAKVSTHRGGEREVAFKASGRDERWAFVMTIGQGSSGNEAYDHVRSVFGDAAVDKEHLLAVVADQARLQEWQESSLRDHGQVARESEQQSVWTQLAAAS